MNILNIADVPGALESVTTLLTGNPHYHVSSVDSLEEVRNALGTDKIDIIIADSVRLRDGEGELIKSLLKKHVALNCTPLVVLAELEGGVEATLDGFPPDSADIICKPLKKNLLLHKMALFQRIIRAEKGLSGIERRLESTIEELREKRTYLSSILQSTKHVAIVAIDLDFKIRYYNHESERLLGYVPEKDIDRDIFTVLEENDIPETECQNALETLIREGVYRFLYSSKKVKEKIVLDTRVSFIKDQDTNKVGFLLVGHDITELKQKEDDLNGKAFKLAESNKELEQLARIISHDLQEPLRTVSGFSKILEASFKEKIDDDTKSSLKYINSGLTHMRDMLNALLEYSGVGNGASVFESVDCDHLLEKVLCELNSTIVENKADIIVESLPAVHGDEAALSKLFQNLLENSIKFRNKENPKIIVKAEKEEGMWLFSVSDNSIGIDNLFLERIFKIFQKLHEKDRYSGTGMGLAICKKIVENHSGRIWAESRGKTGSVFYFLIPEDQRQVL